MPVLACSTQALAAMRPTTLSSTGRRHPMATAADRIRILLDRDPEPELPAPEHHGEFVTRDSGERKQWETGMQRDTNEDKIRPDLMFARYLPYHKQLIIRFMELMTRGAVKYDARNW